MTRPAESNSWRTWPALAVLLASGVSGAAIARSHYDPPVDPRLQNAAITLNRIELPLEGSAESLEVTDINADGREDIVVGSRLFAASYLRRHDGTFSPPTSSDVPFARLGDMNGDGYMDAVGHQGRSVTIAAGAGDGTFGPPTYFPGGPDWHGGNPTWADVLLVAELTGDGAVDVVTQGDGALLEHLFLHRGTGSGTLGAVERLVVHDNGGFRVAAADMNADGSTDLVVTTCGYTLAILLNNGSGVFTRSTGSFGCSTAPEDRLYGGWHTATDVDHDGSVDIAGTYAGRLSYALGNGDGTRRRAAELPVMPAHCRFGECGWLSTPAAADFNGDGFFDFALTLADASRMLVVPSVGPGEWGPAEWFATRGPAPGVDAIDYNGDHRMDIVVAGDSFVSIFPSLAPAIVNVLMNGDFAEGTTAWSSWPVAPSQIVMDAAGGRLRFYRPAGSAEGSLLQATGRELAVAHPLSLTFALGNSDSARKRVSVILFDQDWSDFAFCTFWLEPGQEPRPYAMRASTNERWANASVGFYAASVNAAGSTGAYVLDDVVLDVAGNYQPSTDCIDPNRPAASAGPVDPTSSLVANGEFSEALAPWAPWNGLEWRRSAVDGNAFLEFFGSRPGSALLQSTGAAVAEDQRIVTVLRLGNSSSARQRVTLVLHDANFSDLAACVFWLPPDLPLTFAAMRSYVSRPWANASISIYPATMGSPEALQWLRLDSVKMERTGASTLGTECFPPVP